MVHGERPQALVDAGDGRERHEFAAGRADIEHGKRIRACLILRFDLGDHPVLVSGRVDGGYLPFAIGGRQRVLNLIRRDSKRRRFGPVDPHVHLRVLDLEVGVDVLQARQRAHLGQEVVRDRVQLLSVGALERELEAALGELPADLNRRRVL